MVSQQSSIFLQIEEKAAYWDPTSQRLYPHPIATQPGERGYREKQKAFVSWILESSNREANPETIRTWFKRKAFPVGWDAFFQIWLQVNSERIAA